MNASGRRFHLVSVALFTALALLQGARAALGWPVQIGGFAVPVAASAVVAAVAAALAVWGWRTRE
jgi:hypothetical protein